MNSEQCKNTDKEIWREREGDYYADSIFVTKQGHIGINCGGYVTIMPVRKWHESARPAPAIGDVAKQLAGIISICTVVEPNFDRLEQISNMAQAALSALPASAPIMEASGLTATADTSAEFAESNKALPEASTSASDDEAVERVAEALAPFLYDLNGPDLHIKAAKAAIATYRQGEK
jgi:hypothetical protein